MARRPSPNNGDDALTEDDVLELRQSLAHLSEPSVKDYYRSAWRDCEIVFDRLPSPKKIQTLVQVWKQLRGWRRR